MSPRKLRHGNLKETIGLLHKSATPEVYVRALKTLKQSIAPASTTGFITSTQTSLDRWGWALGALQAVWAALQSLWDNTLDNAQKLLSDEPNTKAEVEDEQG